MGSYLAPKISELTRLEKGATKGRCQVKYSHDIGIHAFYQLSGLLYIAKLQIDSMVSI